MKKFLALILCIATLFSVFSFAVNAEENTLTESTEEIIIGDDNSTEQSGTTLSDIGRKILLYPIGIIRAFAIFAGSLVAPVGCIAFPPLFAASLVAVPIAFLNLLMSFVGLSGI